MAEDCRYYKAFHWTNLILRRRNKSNIIQALQILKSSNYPDADKSLNKIADCLATICSLNGWKLIFPIGGSPEKERNNITALERAIINKYVITFTYFNAGVDNYQSDCRTAEISVSNHMHGILLPIQSTKRYSYF